MQERSGDHKEPGLTDDPSQGGVAAKPAVRGGRRAGFTFIELMIVVLIIGILARLALPYFKNQIREGRRSDAKTALLDLASREERYFATNNTYTSSLAVLYSSATNTSTVLYVPNGDQASSDYEIEFPTPYPTATSYSISAVPQNDQANDYCGTYTYDNFGDQGNSGNTITTGCW